MSLERPANRDELCEAFKRFAEANRGRSPGVMRLPEDLWEEWCRDGFGGVLHPGSPTDYPDRVMGCRTIRAAVFELDPAAEDWLVGLEELNDRPASQFDVLAALRAYGGGRQARAARYEARTAVEACPACHSLLERSAWRLGVDDQNDVEQRLSKPGM